MSLLLTLVSGSVLTSFLIQVPQVQAASQQREAIALQQSSTPPRQVQPAFQTPPPANFQKSLAIKTATTALSAQTPFDGLGDLPFYTYAASRNLTDQLSMKVNVASGNLLLHQDAVNIKGTGLDLNLGDYFNSLNNELIVDAGWNWNWSFGRGIALDVSNPNAGVTLAGPSGFHAYYPADGNGEFTDAPGLNATLYHFHDASNNYVLHFHQSGLTWNFNGTYGNLFSIQDKNGNLINADYDADGYSTQAVDSQGRTVLFEKGTTNLNANQLTKITDSTGRTAIYTYVWGDLTSIQNTNGKTTSFTYDNSTDDRVATITDPLNHQTSFIYAPDGKVTKITDANNKTITFTYNTGNTVVTDQNNHSTTYYYNSNLQVTKTTNALGYSTTNTYDATNYNVTQYGDALSDLSDFQFSTDGKNNLTQVSIGDTNTGGSNPTVGPTTHFGYGGTGNNTYNPFTQTDPQGHSTNYAYDTNGNLLSAIDQQTNKGLTYTYNGNGTVATQQDANGNTTTYGYDALGNLKTITQPSPLGQTSLTVDALSRVSTLTDGNTHKTTYTYDKQDRVTDINYNSQSDVKYTYDDAGNVLTEQDSTGTTTFQYDVLNRLTQKKLPGGTLIKTTYDNVGNLTIYDDSTGDITYSYDTINRVTTVQEPDGAQTTYGYDHANHKTSIRYPNGTGMLMAFNTAGQETASQSGIFTSSTSNTFSTAYTNYQYTYQSGPNPTSLLQSVQYLDPITHSGTLTTSYSYSGNGLNFLLEASTKNASNSVVEDNKYGYDNNGNITSKQVQSTGLNESYSYNAASELITRTNGSGSTTYSYDGIGNLIGSTAGGTLSYNVLNQTTKNGSTNYTYSGTTQSERVQVNSDTFVYGGLGLTTAKTTAGTTEYVRCSCGLLNNERTPDGKKYYYLFDGLGSVVGMTNSTGQEVNAYKYDPYGNIVSQQEQSGLNNPWKYAGGYYDSSTGLTKFGIRYYDPTVGRWTQRTPVGGSLQETLKGNPYMYADNNPVNEMDPSGALPDPTEIFAGIGVGAAVGAFFGLLDGLFQRHGGWELGKDVLCGAISGGIEGGLTAALGPLFDVEALAKVAGKALAEQIVSFEPHLIESLSGGLCSVIF
ncbi:type IV secretion protein Rhs [Tengunoibacter tsumagoiensis]|uniref:Type IV secretion protein Rhs n=1 Tax=Tengunoibacter tsumagoiensis TaxID=2014871 RepID=A0A402A2G9_9CHLR|nr:type IV secretion protein Rhs [Tengunoibacter tsumagoiensis]